MKFQINGVLDKIRDNQHVISLIKLVKDKSLVAYNYWQRLSLREKYLLGGLGVLLILFLLTSLISAAVGLNDDLEKKYVRLQTDKIKAVALVKVYKDLSHITANEFSSVKLDRIKGDIQQLLKVDNPDVMIQDNVLTIKVDNITFESGMLFLEQMRKSYGLFPDTLLVTTTFNPGYVAFKVTFKVEM